MEEKKTMQYKRTLRGSVGAGMSALMGGSGRRYYILEHRDASKYHKAGESQKIIIDQIELGRGNDCQVRFDETFETVSRRHAAIIRDGDRWKLVQLSTTNTTFLNGRAIDTEWYLQNGDEIQLAVGGPRLGFIVPEGKQGLVSSIKLTHRIKLASEQALKPYKRAITAMAVVLVLAFGGLGTWNFLEHRDFLGYQEKTDNTLARQDSALARQDSTQVAMQKAIAHTVETDKERQSQLTKIEERNRRLNSSFFSLQNQISEIKNHVDTTRQDQSDVWRKNADPWVFYLETTKIEITKADGTKEALKYGWSGTGFLLDDGRFVTAKHCVVGWQFGAVRYNDKTKEIELNGITGEINQRINEAVDVTVYITARSSGGKFTFTNKDVVMTDKTDDIGLVQGKKVHVSYLDNTDWAYIRTNAKGNGLNFNANWSMTPKSGAKLKILGYPNGYVSDDYKPLEGSCMVAHEGLDKGRITITEKNYEPGNSGGPVFIVNNGKAEVVGIVSAHTGNTIGFIIPIGGMNQ